MESGDLISCLRVESNIYTLGRNSMRRAIPKELQVAVFRRDAWICRWCGRPVIYAPAMKYLERFVRMAGVTEPIAYHDAHWTRRNAPLLDYMGAVIDHVEAYSRGGKDLADNFATACNKCNANKSNGPQDQFRKKSPRHKVKGRYREPEHWDGLSTLFVVLAQQAPQSASSSERDWVRALKCSATAHDSGNCDNGLT
jgi:5-methylcytosine-specific restriction endonuclease McrA